MAGTLLVVSAYTTRLLATPLGITPDEIDGGRCPFLSRPNELAERLEAYRAEQQTSASA